jgi:hypothetical protein
MAVVQESFYVSCAQRQLVWRLWERAGLSAALEEIQTCEELFSRWKELY